MRYLLMSSVLCLALESSPVMAWGSNHGGGSTDIGYNAGRDMATRLWDSKYHRDCFRSDRFLAELSRMQNGLSSSNYHRGYRSGIERVENDVAQSCHSTQVGHTGEPKGECPQTGYQHGANLGTQVCNDSIMSQRSFNTCFQQALASCFDGLKTYVQNNCRSKAYTPAYRQAERECQQTFARR